MNNPKVLVFDIETTPMTAYVWGLRDQNIGLNQIVEEWSVMAWAAKWLGDPASKVIYKDNRKAKNVRDDKAIVAPLWKLLDEADIVITQNGKNFDSPKLNARFITHGMNPPSPYTHLDTYQIVRRAAKFTSNKLEYLTDKLCTKYKKLSHKKFPGMSLWNECLKGNTAAWNEMKAYNIHDVLSTEEFYLKIRAWAPESAPKPFNIDNPTQHCSTCDKTAPMVKWGFYRKQKSIYQRYSCSNCGAWITGEKLK